MWNPKTTLVTSPQGGVIALWRDSNLFNSTNWTTEADYGNKIFYYFFIPTGFVFRGEKDRFDFNAPLKFDERQREVYGYVIHEGQHWLQEGKTEILWACGETVRESSPIQTDLDTKLPFLIVPARGQPNFLEEKRYFIPLPESA